jgi:hypothetical protein
MQVRRIYLNPLQEKQVTSNDGFTNHIILLSGANCKAIWFYHPIAKILLQFFRNDDTIAMALSLPPAFSVENSMP